MLLTPETREATAGYRRRMVPGPPFCVTYAFLASRRDAAPRVFRLACSSRSASGRDSRSPATRSRRSPVCWTQLRSSARYALSRGWCSAILRVRCAPACPDATFVGRARGTGLLQASRFRCRWCRSLLLQLIVEASIRRRVCASALLVGTQNCCPCLAFCRRPSGLSLLVEAPLLQRRVAASRTVALPVLVDALLPRRTRRMQSVSGCPQSGARGRYRLARRRCRRGGVLLVVVPVVGRLASLPQPTLWRQAEPWSEEAIQLFHATSCDVRTVRWTVEKYGRRPLVRIGGPRLTCPTFTRRCALGAQNHGCD
jgi:hypothetical protein